ncbi:hypothetical protein Tco_0418291 [Tanacetum coccineum]
MGTTSDLPSLHYSQLGKTQSKSSKSSKAPTEPSQTKKVMDKDEQIQDGAVDDIEIAHDGWTQLQMKCHKQILLLLKTGQSGSVVDFTKFVKNCLQKEKIRKADLKERAFKLLKGNYKNYIELEYNFEQCYLPLIDQTDWINLERERVSYDLSKPLVLQGPPVTPVVHTFHCRLLLQQRSRVSEEKKHRKEFSDGTLKPVRDILKTRLNNFVLGYNASMPKRVWTEINLERTTTMLEHIEKTLLAR